jgi:flotillin
MPVALTLPFAAMQISLGDANTWIVIGVILFLLFSLSFGLMLITRYRRCPSNKVLVIYGKVAKGESAKCLHGGGAFVWPLVQAYEYLDLEPIQIEVPLRGALSSENIRVNVPSYFTVAIGTAPEIMQNAAIRLLGLKTEEVKGQALDIIFGQLRQVIASMPIEAINRDRDVFLKNIQESLEPELEKIGLVLINVNITDITDESGYIEALGRKAASEAIQKAEVDVAEQVKLGAIGVKGAERDREIEVARAVKLREIGTKDAEREMAVRVAELAKARAVGEQTALYEQEARIKEAERAKRIEVAKANAEAVTGENLSKASIAASEAELKVKQAEAYAVGETRHREAEAAVLAAQYRAQALAAEANATRVEAEQRAQFEAPARAQKARITVEAEAEAERLKLEAAGRASAIALEAEGQAKAIYAKLEAQARGEYEILAKKGEGLREIVQGCGGAEAAFKLMMLEHLDHLAETASKAIANVKFDKVIVWDGGNGNGGASGFLSGLGRSIPPLMDIMRNLGGVELPDYLGKMVEQPPVADAKSESADEGKPAGTAPSNGG